MAWLWTFSRAGSAWRGLGMALALCLGFLLPARALPPKGRASVKVGINADFPPYEFINAAGQPDGYDVDLIRATAEAMDLPLQFEWGPWDQIRGSLEAGRIDVVPGMLFSEERARRFSFGTEHLVIHYSLFVRKGSTVTRLEDLRGRRIAVERGSQMADSLVQQGFEGERMLVGSEPEALRLLAKGEPDAAILPKLVGLGMIRDLHLGNLQVVGGPVYERSLCFAVGKDNLQLKSSLDTGLAILNRTGRHREIQRKWFGDLEPGPRNLAPALRAAGWAFLALLAGAGGILAWSWALRRQVRQRTLDLHLANRSLRESERHLATVVDALPVAVFGKDPNHDFRYTTWNACSEAIFGLPRERVLGRTDLELFPPEQAEAYRQTDLVVMAGGAPVDTPEMVLEAGPARKLLHTIKVPIMDSEGRPRHLLGLAEDITERKTAEAALRQAQKLESLGVLAGGIAHDFNNLLTAVMGNLNLAQAQAEEGARVVPYLARIEAIVDRAANLTHQMLAYAGKGKFQVTPLSLNDVARDMTHLLGVSMSKRVAVAYRFLPDLPQVDADPAQIQQVIMNMVTNASEAIGDMDGTITLRTGTEILDEGGAGVDFHGAPVRPGPYVTLEVADTGCGMDAGTLAMLFDPFFTTKFSGRGLGLSALLGILKGHRAGIRIRSEMGRGSSFKLYFPASREAAPCPVPPVAPSDFRGGEGTILVVDDEAEVRASTARILESMGYRTLEAGDGLEGLAVYRAHAADISLVIMDLTMPRMDGRQAYLALRQSDPAARVVLTSGFAEAQAIQGFPYHGLAGFLQKPFSAQGLRELLGKVLAAPSVSGSLPRD